MVQLGSMAELAEFLQSAPSFELTKKIASDLSEQVLPRNPRRIVIENFILSTQFFMNEIFEELRTDLEKHSYNYPFLMLRIPLLNYESTSGRETYQGIQSQLRRIPGLGRKYIPRKIRDHVVPSFYQGLTTRPRA
jgi:hypothetical protein